MNGQIRVVRVTKPSMRHPLEGPDSPIRSVRIILCFAKENKISRCLVSR